MHISRLVKKDMQSSAFVVDIIVIVNYGILGYMKMCHRMISAEW